jgi:hypothetical protein
MPTETIRAKSARVMGLSSVAAAVDLIYFSVERR